MTRIEDIVVRCVYPKCAANATFDSPADLCDFHWNEWWDYKIEVEDRKVTKKESLE